MMEDILQGKSAKMWVQEICVKQMVRPDYVTSEVIPGQSPPTFICKLSIKYADKVLRAEALGKTKKETEQEAARQMLFQGLEMTPAKLLALNNSSKKTSATEAGENSENDNGDVDQVESVSDTDDNECAANPIGNLFAICNQYELDEPNYTVIKEEGPAHRKVFTMGCEVCAGDETVASAIGRRGKKQMAKKLAAFRTLRSLKHKGYQLTSFQDNPSDNVDMKDDHVHVPQKIVVDSIERELSVPDEVFDAIDNLSGRIYCKNVSERCLELCVNYGHAFQHLNKSETLDLILATSIIDDALCNQYGGPMPLLEKIAREIECSIHISTFPNNDIYPKVAFLELTFPFKRFKNKIPLVNSVHSEGRTMDEAISNAAMEALKFLKVMTSSDSETTD